MVDAARRLEHLCVYLRPFNDTSLQRKLEGYQRDVEHVARLLRTAELELLSPSVPSRAVAEHWLAEIKRIGASNEEQQLSAAIHILNDQRRLNGMNVPAEPNYAWNVAFHDQFLASGLPDTVMTCCIRSEQDRVSDSGAALAWDGYMWHHHLPYVGDGEWNRAPAEQLSFDALFNDLGPLDWRVAVDMLVREASILVMVPSANRGTHWELQLLKFRQLLDRTIFVKPSYVAPEEWAETRRALWDDLRLPEFRPGGFFFTAAQRRSDKARWQEIADYNFDSGSVSHALNKLRPELLEAVRRKPRDRDLPVPEHFRWLVDTQFLRRASDQ